MKAYTANMVCPSCATTGNFLVEVGREDDSKPRLWCPTCGTLIENDTISHVPTRSPYAQESDLLGLGMHAGLMLVAADAVRRANGAIELVHRLRARAWDADLWPKLIDASQGALEALSEAVAAIVEEVDAQNEDIAAIAVELGDKDPKRDPDRLRDLLRRTLRRRRAKT